MKSTDNSSNSLFRNSRRGWDEIQSRSVIEEKKGTWFERCVEAPALQLYQTVIIETILRLRPVPPSKDGRHIPLDVRNEQELIDERRGQVYLSNSIRSSRYTIWDFLPKQFIFQATRLSNFYFICIGVPQTIPGFSTTGNYTTILPLAFFLILTIIKEGYDDYRRHRLDTVENNTLARVLRNRKSIARSLSAYKLLQDGFDQVLRSMPLPTVLKPLSNKNLAFVEDADQDAESHWTMIKWHELRVGDVLKLRRNDPVPADVALLHASGENGVAYVETMALDGETSLKVKQAPTEFRMCSHIQGIKETQAEFVVEDPNRDLYDLKGSVTTNGTTIPLSLNQVLLRGSILRNTNSAIGMIINTGEECRIRMNANHHPKAKKPRLEKYTNQVVLALIIYVVILSVGCSIGYLIWHSNYEVHAWYLNNAYVPYKQIIIGYLIMFNNVIPLALYVSLEIIKIGQMLMIAGDLNMYDEASDAPMKCNTNTILENLGQVSYVLSDKTGTLTENVMRFRGLSVAGIAWSHTSSKDPVLPSPDAKLEHEKHTSVVSKSAEHGKIDSHEVGLVSEVVVQETEISTPDPLERQASNYITRPGLNRMSTNVSRRERARPASTELLEYIRLFPNTDLARKAREFLLSVALCHTAIPEIQEDGELDFQASSPDELALVRAAQDFGIIVSNRSSQSITLLSSNSTGGETRDVYEILNVIEFSSKRKRMSIIVKCPDERIWLLCKGADSAILPRLQQATLASRKSVEVRQSIEVERERYRRIEVNEPRNSFGGRPSLTLRQRSSMDVRPSMDIELTSRRRTLEVPTYDHPKTTRTVNHQRTSRASRFSFLNDLAGLDEAAIFGRCFRHLDEFATEGLRTLLFAGRYLGESEYAAWRKLYQDAATSLVDRQERIEEVGDTIEQGFDLLGASAIEDKLQQGVPETIEKLRKANMKVWMLTGDKRETAINIAHAAQICQLSSSVQILDSTQGDLEGQVRELIDTFRDGVAHSVVVIDGQTLGDVEESPVLKDLFYSIITTIDSVICCRASPAQKAAIVQAIRLRQSGLTLAIGDGANDIAMITASHVGIGISGKEGLQAARVADYSIAQFRFLQRLLLVHGRWNYDRTAKFILWTYWKEMFFYMAQAMYQQPNGYSGSSLYENWSLTALNTLFTSLCVISPGIFEQDLRAETLLAVPELYVYGQRNKGLNLPRYIRWMVLAIAEGIFIWTVPWILYGKGDFMGDNNAFALGDLCFSLAIMWTNTKLLILETHSKTRIIIISFAITVGGWLVWNIFLNAAYTPQPSPFDVRGSLFNTFGKDPVWWAVLVLTWMVLVVFEISLKFVRRNLLLWGLWPLRVPAWRGLASFSWFDRFGHSKTADVPPPEEVSVEVWQELERDPLVRRRLETLARGGDESLERIETATLGDVETFAERRFDGGG